jgi:2-oxoglutarate dehydrogenase E1 component
VKRVVFCSGKVYYDLVAKPVADDIAVVRVEELYPWPHAALSKVLDRYPKATELVWAQEEPKNMGAWSYVAPRLRGSAGNAVVIRYVGRPERASPAEGYPQAHADEQARIVADATGPTTRPSGTRRTTGVMRAL